MSDSMEGAEVVMPDCPVPIANHEAVAMAHGGGGRLMHALLDAVFLPALQGTGPGEQHDGAVLDLGGVRVALTTDSFVVHPLFFPGGDIGTLAINGTVNDLAMCGARPAYLSAGFVLEEGLPLETLRRVVASMHDAAAVAGVRVVTGDTKVVDRGKCDGIFINTAGIGVVAPGVHIAPSRVQPGDAVLLSGDIGRHGIAIMAVREGLEFDTTLESDCAPVSGAVMALLDAGIRVHCLRDLTRGGLASALVEIAQAAGRDIEIVEREVPVREDVQGACEILGLDPLYVANEGRFVAFVEAADAPRALEIMRSHPAGDGACRIGQVVADGEGGGLVTMKSSIGVSHIVDMLSGEQLPRIC